MGAADPDLPPDLRELVGIAVNASELTMELRSERALDRVAALGAAALHIHHGADRRGEPVAATMARPGHQVDPQDALAAELSVCLWHIRYAGQFGMVASAVWLFAQWMAYRGRFNGVADAGSLLPRLAARAIHESLSGRCIACGGSGKLERSRSGSWLRPRGSMQRNATYRTCTSCDGSRRQPISHTERRIALGITRERYDQERWDGHCKAALTWLERNMGRLTRPLTVQLERSKKRE